MSEVAEIKEFKKAEEVLSKGNAKNVLQKMLDYYEIDIDDIEDKEMKKAIKQGYDRLVKATRFGRLKVNFDNGIEVIQTTRANKTEIKYREIDGVAKTEMAGKDPNDNYGKAYALMGALSGLGEGAIKQLKGVDLSLAEVLGFIFLSV